VGNPFRPGTIRERFNLSCDPVRGTVYSERMKMIFALLVAVSRQAAPSEKEATEFARKIESSILTDEGAWVDQNFDLVGLLETALKDVQGDPKRKDGFGRGVRESFQLGKATAEAVKEKGRYTFIRTRSIGGKVRLLFRLVTPAGFNYHDFLLGSSAKSGLAIVDLYIYTSGEWISQTFRRAFVTMLASDPAGGKLRDNEYMKNLDKIQKMTALKNEGKNAEVLQVFASLPAGLKTDKTLLLMRCQAALEVGEKEAIEAIEAMRKVYPQDPALSLLSIQPFLSLKKYDQALACVDALEKETGGDPYLDYERGEIQFAAGAMDKARQAGVRAVETDPKLKEPRWLLVSVSLREKKFDETARQLTAIEKELGIRIADLTRVAVYAEFVKSPEYGDWMKSRGQ